MTPRNDRERIRAAFADFRRRGYWAREAQPDGWHAVPEDRLRRAGKVVFWHVNEVKICFDETGKLGALLHMNHFDKDAEEIAAILKSHDLRVKIDPVKGVIVMPKDWKE